MARAFELAPHSDADRLAQPSRRSRVLAVPRLVFEGWLVLAALVAGGAVRAAYVGTDPFPLHDGGLFRVMIDELIRAGFAIPYVTGYNGGDIPFAYPPFGLYLAALVSVVADADPTMVIARLPAVLSALTVPTFFFLARAATGSARAGAFAALFFGLMPATFTWMIVGGGATRAPGYLLSVAAVAVLLAAFRSGSGRAAAGGGVLFGLAALSHPQFAWYALVMLAIAFAFRARRVATWKAGLVAGALALAIVTPWLALVLARHGPEPLLAAFATNGFADSRRETTLGRVWESLYEPVLGTDAWVQYGGAAPLALGLVGAAVSVWRRQPLAAAWLVLLPLAGSRAGPQVFALPLACLCGVAADAAWRLIRPSAPVAATGSADDGPVLPGSPDDGAGPPAPPRPTRSALLRTAGMVGAALGLVAVLGAQARVALADPLHLLTRLTPDERASMRWVAEHTSSDSQFLILKPRGADGWWDDALTEWFPALAERTSLATPQGREWLPEFRIAIRKYEQLQNCAEATTSCLEDWEERFGVQFTHVYVPKRGREPRLRRSLDGREELELAYDGPAAWIYRRR